MDWLDLLLPCKKKKKNSIFEENFIYIYFIIFVIDFILYFKYHIFENLTSTLDF